MLVPINITGGTYKLKSLSLAAQTTRNFWPVKPDNAKSKSPYVLETFHGLKLFAENAIGVDRGMFEHLGIVYKVTGNNLYRVDSAGTHVQLGIINGTGRCIFTGIGTSIVIVANGVVYVWSGTGLTTVTDSDLESPNGCAHINNQIIYDGNNGRFCTSDVGDAKAINGLNYATAESNADDLLRAYVFNQYVYMMGDKTIEPWWNSGTGSPPFDRVEGGIMQIGLAALHSPAHNDKYMYFLGDDSQVYAVQGTTPQVVSDDALSREISRYATISDAIGSSFTLNGTPIYGLTFPTQDKTFLYPEGGEWFEWSYGADGGRSLANSYCFAFRKHLFADYRNGNIYELDEDTYTDNSGPIIRTRDTAPIHGGLINRPGKTLTMNSFELILEAGVGLITGQGSAPVVMLSFSDDGGKTFSNEMWATVGKMGDFMWKCAWFALGSFESRIIRVRTSDPVHYSIHSASSEIEVGI